MNTVNRETAKIYQFPVNAADRPNRTKVSNMEARPAMAVGESWYHEAAVQEEARAKTVIVPLTFPRQ